MSREALERIADALERIATAQEKDHALRERTEAFLTNLPVHRPPHQNRPRILPMPEDPAT